MAFRDFLRAPHEAPTGHCEVPLSRDADAFLPSTRSNVFLPYMRNDDVQDPLASAVEPGPVGETDLGFDLPPAVERPDFDKLLATRTRGASPTSRRRLLWEIWDGYHCSICGTCLSFGELGRIAARVGLQFESDESEHGIHGHFVQLAAKKGRVAKLTHKVLDRKYRSAIDRFRRAKSEAQVGELWGRALAEGDIPGPYWALMTHPRSTSGLMVRAFGEVHMLSHLAGATNRADIRRLRALEGERQELTEQLAAARRRLFETQAEHRCVTDDHEAEKRELANRLQAAQAAEVRLEQLEGRLRELEDGETARTLRARNAALESELGAARRRLRTETQRRSTLEHELSALQATLRDVSTTAEALSAECDDLESMLEAGIDDANGGGAIESDRAVDLCGRRVAYVGGRSGIVGHFRALVERLNGHFIHHDGGIEDHEGQLGRILGQADVVLCPVDCVSHRASLRAKRFCKRTAKPFVPLRTAGLSSFVTGLRRATESDGALAQRSA